LRQKPRPKKVKTADDNEIDMNSLSGVWRLLEAESMHNEFPLTQLGYNFYVQNDKDWIKRRESKTWNQIEITRKKCEDWLKNVKK
jgi:L,D-peptidoglycan transpeptidase YkuD (ErfK/YbiS/YcfS/YnhG family)